MNRLDFLLTQTSETGNWFDHIRKHADDTHHLYIHHQSSRCDFKKLVSEGFKKRAFICRKPALAGKTRMVSCIFSGYW
ncbi:MAG: hypothetical protein WB502_05665 [Thermoactinomyces sp.]